jgi:hypothetical protein
MTVFIDGYEAAGTVESQSFSRQIFTESYESASKFYRFPEETFSDADTG